MKKIIIGTSKLGSSLPFAYTNKKYKQFLDYAVKNAFYIFDSSKSYRHGNAISLLKSTINHNKNIKYSVKIGYKHSFLSKLLKRVFNKSNRIIFNDYNLCKMIDEEFDFNTSNINYCYLHSPNRMELKSIDLRKISYFLNGKFKNVKIAISTDSLFPIIDLLDKNCIHHIQIPYIEYQNNKDKYRKIVKEYNIKIILNRVLSHYSKKNQLDYFYNKRLNLLINDKYIYKIIIGVSSIQHLNSLIQFFKKNVY